jgi:hypothetical protein
MRERIRAMSEKIFSNGEIVNIRVSNELVTILKSHYVKNMKRYSYTVDKYPSTFFFEEELKKREL